MKVFELRKMFRRNKSLKKYSPEEKDKMRRAYINKARRLLGIPELRDDEPYGVSAFKAKNNIAIPESKEITLTMANFIGEEEKEEVNVTDNCFQEDKDEKEEDNDDDEWVIEETEDEKRARLYPSNINDSHCDLCADDSVYFGPSVSYVDYKIDEENELDSEEAIKNTNACDLLNEGENDMAMALNKANIGVIAPHVVEEVGAYVTVSDLRVFSDLNCGLINLKGQRIYGHGVIIDPPFIGNDNDSGVDNVSGVFKVCPGDRIYPIVFSDGSQCLVGVDDGETRFIKIDSGLIGFTYCYDGTHFYSEYEHNIYINGTLFKVRPYNSNNKSNGLYYVIKEGVLYQWRKDNYMVFKVSNNKIFDRDYNVLGRSELDKGKYRFRYDKGKFVCISRAYDDDPIDIKSIVGKKQADSLPSYNLTSVKSVAMKKGLLSEIVARNYNYYNFDFRAFALLRLRGYDYDDTCVLRTLLSFGMNVINFCYCASNLVFGREICPRVRYVKAPCLCLQRYINIGSKEKSVNVKVVNNVEKVLRYYKDYVSRRRNSYYDYIPYEDEDSDYYDDEP